MRLHLLLALALPGLLAAQKADKPKWDITHPTDSTHDVKFTIRESSWSNLDLSPDGKTLVFDLLGDIYTMPATGGKATVIAEGLPFEQHPRFSPDGQWIAFTSDRAGGDNLWIMKADGSDKRQVTKESFRLMSNPVWTPDGQYLIGRKHFTALRSAGAGEMWMYHRSGGDGQQLTKRKNDQQDSNEPFVSPDGKFLYYCEDNTPGPSFQYNKDPNNEIYATFRVNLTTGERQYVTGGPGSACRPTLSHDGKTLAFVRRVRFKSTLWLHDLATGEERMVFDSLSRDQQETWAILGTYPNFAFSPDDKHVYMYGLGNIHKVELASGKSVKIPFEAEYKQSMVNVVHSTRPAMTDSIEANMLRHITTSPDGSLIAFVAFGQVYFRYPTGSVVQVTHDTVNRCFHPVFSPDGKAMLYTTWNDADGGALWYWPIATSGSGRFVPQSNPVRLTDVPGFYHEPAFSPDGKRVAYRKGTGDGMHGRSFSTEPGLYTVNIDGSNRKKEQEDGEQPKFSADGKELFFLLEEGPLKKSYRALNLTTRETRTVFSTTYANQFAVSPDNKWVAFTELYQAYIAPFPKTGNPVELSGKATAFPVKKVSRDAGTNLHWSTNSESLHWVLGNNYFTRRLDKTFAFITDVADSTLADAKADSLHIHLKVAADKPAGRKAFTNARIVTMEGDKVIENGYVVVNGNRIEAVGTGAYKAKGDEKITDCKGKTIIPGLIDVHSHMGVSYTGVSPTQQWSYMANLAYGVTTTHDPSTLTEMVFSQHEMIEAGKMIGPRVFSTGTILYGADGDFKAVVNSLADAQGHLRRMQAVGAFSVKSYNQPRREQRQQVLQAARELKMHVYPEGGSNTQANLSMISDGHTGIEHSITYYPLYEDVTKFWSAGKTAYTPTLIVGYGGLWGENYWYAKTNVWENQKLLTFVPRTVVDSRSRRRTLAPDEEWNHIENSRGCKKLYDAGVKLQIGSHGQLEGLGAHWEIWMLAQGGMKPLEALRCATQYGADYLGMAADLGSISTGKLADFVILDKNPLEDIQNTDDIAFIVKNGRQYTPNLDEVGGKPRKKMWWELRPTIAAFGMRDLQLLHAKCSCGMGM